MLGKGVEKAGESISILVKGKALPFLREKRDTTVLEEAKLDGKEKINTKTGNVCKRIFSGLERYSGIPSLWL
jgi:hypothetical protein